MGKRVPRTRATKAARTTEDATTAEERADERAAENEGARAWGALVPPATVDELHGFVEKVMGVRLVREARMRGHAAPMDYIAHTFFEGRLGKFAGQEPDCVLRANRGGGKTFLGALASLLDMLFKPGVQIRLLGGSLEQSQRMHEHLKALVGSPGVRELIGAGAARVTARKVVLKNGSVAEVLAASQTSVRGTRVQKVRCDEVDLFDPEVWEAAQLTTRSMDCAGPWGDEVRGSVEALSTMHRPLGLMWRIVNGTRERRGEATENAASAVPAASRPVLRWGVLDVLEDCGHRHKCAGCALEPECAGAAKLPRSVGPGGHVRVSDARRMKSRVGRATWESEMLCLKPGRTDAVFPEFDTDVHVVSDDAAAGPFVNLVAGMDFGFRAEAVLLLAGVDAEGVVTVIREHAAAGVRVVEHARMLKEWLSEIGRERHERGEGDGLPAVLTMIGVDPAGRARSDQTGESSIDVLKTEGFTVRSRASRIEAGIALVRARLEPAWSRVSVDRADASSGGRSTPKLRVCRSCTRLIECLTRYRYPESNPEATEPKKDGFDHACDALRYMLVNMEGRSSGREGVRVWW